VTVDRDARDERVMVDLSECRRRCAQLLRPVAGWVDDEVEAPGAKRTQITIAVAAQPLNIWEELRVVSSAIEKRDVMSASESCFNDVAAEEESAAEDKEFHFSWVAYRTTKRCSCSRPPSALLTSTRHSPASTL
jgi:hypothetical protein